MQYKYYYRTNPIILRVIQTHMCASHTVRIYIYICVCVCMCVSLCTYVQLAIIVC